MLDSRLKGKSLYRVGLAVLPSTYFDLVENCIIFCYVSFSTLLKILCNEKDVLFIELISKLRHLLVKKTLR